MLIADGKAGELIEKGSATQDKPRLALYLNQLVENNSQSGYCPDETVMMFDVAFTIPGMDPIVPVIKLEQDGIRIMGTALVDGDRMTGMIDPQETACLLLAMGEHRHPELAFDLPGELAGAKKKIEVLVKKAKAGEDIEIRNGRPYASFKLRLDLIVDEYMWVDLSDKKRKKDLEASISNSVKECLEGVFAKLSATNCDAFGIGDSVRAYYSGYWETIGGEQGWKKVYPGITAEFDVKVDIRSYGVIR